MLITITLLAFLVILLIGLATFTRVETAIAGNTQRQAQARENALFALNVALGQLQKYAGPDQRVTATADAFPNGTGTTHYTGVWDATTTDATPVTWLVSGNELVAADGTANALAITPGSTLNTTNGVPLVSTNTSRVTNDVLARLMPITATGVPGAAATASTTIGRYAWWVGDQGVKAPVAVADSSGSVTYAPYGDGTQQLDLGKRIRQQIALGAGALNTTTQQPEFEPRDSNNTTLVANQKIAAISQIAFLKNASNAQLGLTRVQQNFHHWSPNNYAVIADSLHGGLRQDLSLFSTGNPSPLGAAYDAWADYTTYMEDPNSPATPTPLQPYSSDPLRRRYVMQPASAAYPIGPVLSFFGLSFSIRNNSSTAPTNLEVSTRCVVGLWNPYTSALVPQDLELVIPSGLPVVVVKDQVGNTVNVDLQALLGGGTGLKFLLPFTPNGTDDDRSSWLPGRVYNWSAPSNPGVSGNPGNPMLFYVRDSTPGTGTGVIWPAGPPLAQSPSSAPVLRQCFIASPTTLTLDVRRASDGASLAQFISPVFQSPPNGTTPAQTDFKSIDFAFIFRVPDVTEVPTGETATWLQAAGRDPRESQFSTPPYVVPGGNEQDPSLFGGPTVFQFTSTYPALLLDRDQATGTSYNEDVPIFELPRSPLLSIGELQHFRITGARPFTIGNSWTSGVQLNGIRVDELCDRFFFSGLSSGVTPTTVNGSLLLPNPMLKVLRDPVTGAMPTVTDLQNAPNAQSSKSFLQGGAFNLNSTDPTAWTAVLRSVRFVSGTNFDVLNCDSATATAVDDAKATPADLAAAAADSATAAFYQSVTTNLPTAAFFRFSQSAQEVFKADDNYSQSQFGGGGPVINTPLYRRGVRTLAASEVATLATKITDAIKARLAASGPFDSIEHFLNPSSPGNPSLLEQAIADAGINSSIAEFSSQWLTQADIMTALAPVLFPRSDTFVIRAYGEALNPATSTPAAPVIEGRAWCEAVVQRLPEYFDPSTATGDAAEVAPAALTSTLNQTYGRRFKIVSFRWLTRSDI